MPPVVQPSFFSTRTSECSTFFVGVADPKAVFMDISSPDSPPVHPRFRMNTSFLLDEEHVNTFLDRLLSLESSARQWTEEEYNVII